ncbi:MAG: DNA polymerase [Nocardioides sp.]|nr:DNA polymerase [Nocardioides sp.]
MITYFDVETADADRLWTYGPGFCRLGGYATGDAPVRVTADMAELVDVLHRSAYVVGHNILAFDLPALELHHGLDLARLVREDRVVDTLLAARHNDPPFSGPVDKSRYNLNAVATRYLGHEQGKATTDGASALEVLRGEFGGYDQIPVDHPDLMRYLVQDVEVLRCIAKHLRVDDYLRREHRVMWRLNHISRHGWRVDVAEAERRLAAQRERVAVMKQRLARDYGLPSEGTAPQRSKAGVAALEKALRDCGVEPPRTAKGALATSKDVLNGLAAEHPDNAALLDLCEALRALNGERSTVQTVLDHTHADGRVHPGVDASQATGRISVTKPGLTVMGKRDRANILERSLLLPDEGHVLVAFDLSQVDARAIAGHAQDPAYIACFEPGKDYHTEMAMELFGDPRRRSDAKPVTHATTYGQGAFGLASNAGISNDEAKRLLRSLDLRFPGLARFKKEIRKKAERRHGVRTGFGRPIRITPGKEFTQAPAAMGQGTARDLMMEGILRLPEWLLPHLRAIVHDEIVLSIPAEGAEEAEAAVLDALQYEWSPGPGKVPVPILADRSERGLDWADCYRSEAKWPEVARSHRHATTCDGEGCVWHRPASGVVGAA